MSNTLLTKFMKIFIATNVNPERCRKRFYLISFIFTVLISFLLFNILNYNITVSNVMAIFIPLAGSLVGVRVRINKDANLKVENQYTRKSIIFRLMLIFKIQFPIIIFTFLICMITYVVPESSIYIFIKSISEYIFISDKTIFFLMDMFFVFAIFSCAFLTLTIVVFATHFNDYDRI